MKVVYLSPSTQDRNIGAGEYGSEELRANQITDVIQAKLKKNGVKVYRNTPDMRLKEICTASNNYKVDAHLAVHTNAYDKKSRGCEVFSHIPGIQGAKLAQMIYNVLEQITPTKDRGVKYGLNHFGPDKHIYELNNTIAPSALAEIDFHDNQASATWIMNNIQLIGSVIADALLEFLGVKQKVQEILYRVIVGSYSNIDNAKEHMNKLKLLGQESFTLPYKK